MAVVITSPANPTVRQIAALKRRKHRLTSGTYLIEGTREVERADHGGRTSLLRVVLSPDIATGRTTDLAEAIAGAGAQLILLGESAFSKVSMRRHPDGLLVVASGGFLDLDDLTGCPPPFVIADGIEKPGNLGAIVRTADACGMGAVVATDDGVDPTNPNVIRASQGSVFTVPVAVASLEGTLLWMERSGVTVFAGSPQAETDLWEVDLRGRVALAVGSEHLGLSDNLSRRARLIRIPTRGAADSLNTSSAAAMMMYEALRQTGA